MTQSLIDQPNVMPARRAVRLGVLTIIVFYSAA